MKFSKTCVENSKFNFKASSSDLSLRQTLLKKERERIRKRLRGLPRIWTMSTGRRGKELIDTIERGKTSYRLFGVVSLPAKSLP